MDRNLIFITFALVSLVMAGPGDRAQKGPGGEHKRGPGGPGGAHHFLPPFFRNVSDEGKKEIGDVFKNENLTIAQIDTQIAALAEKYGAAAAYKEFKTKEEARHAEVKKNTTSVISSLSSIASQLASIHENKDQTRKAQHAAVESLRKDNRVAVDTVEFIAKRLGGFGGRQGGHRGGPGGKGGRGKFGGKHGDKKDEKKDEKRGPRGGDKDEKKTKEAVAAPKKI